MGGSPASTLLQKPAWHRGATEKAPRLDTEELAWVVHRKVNGLRQGYGLAGLAWAEDLKLLALGHSRNNGTASFLRAHESPRPCSSDRPVMRGFVPLLVTTCLR